MDVFIGRENITPEQPVMQAGFAARRASACTTS